MTIQNVYHALDRLAPFSTQMDFDNSGILIGSESDKAGKILVSLDVTNEVIDFALHNKCELIVSHHPVIFSPLKKVSSQSMVYKLIKHGIGVISAHTNFDIAKGGMNDLLCEKLGLKHVAVFGLSDGSDAPGLGRIGELPEPMLPHEFARYMADVFGEVRCTCGGKIKRIAVCAGSGGEWIYAAAKHSAHAFITGEIKHHEILDAQALGLMVVDAGHFATEEIFRSGVRDYLQTALPNAEIMISPEENPMKRLF